MSDLHQCPQCPCDYAYEDGRLLVCPECGHEWSAAAPGDVAAGSAEEQDALVIKDAVGNILADGDTVSIIKDLKVKGASAVVKVGTKIGRAS
ncbi:MAG: zinc ribbon domain-containing protein YjdM, partial [Phycisphaeraceae bacterium]